MTDKPITTPAEMLEAVEATVNQLGSEVKQVDGWAVLLVERQKIRDALRVLRSRIAPPDPRHEGLRERIEKAHAWQNRVRVALKKEERPEFLYDSLVDLDWLLRDCFAALSEPADPQPTADDVVRAVREALRANAYSGDVERAIRAAFNK